MQSNTNLKILSSIEQKKIENFCKKNKSLKNIGILVCLYTGLKIDEICALKWNCINLEQRFILVKYNLQRIYNKIEKKSTILLDIPKKTSSIRTISIPTKLYKLLKPLQEKYSNNSFFLTGSTVDFIEPRTYYKVLKSICKKCKIQDIPFKQLRYSFAVDCINKGIDAESLRKILGYDNIEVILKNFSFHLSESEDFNKKMEFLEML